jgi:fumarylacetoacetase
VRARVRLRPVDPPGERIAIDDAAERIFGFVLLNDWSARDIQAWEYVPLGPFLGKSFATSISPWIVPPSELSLVEPRVQDPPPLDYLRAERPWTVDVDIHVFVGDEQLARVNPSWLYWTPQQMLTHATVNGATLTAGDLFGTGTISGEHDDSLGCLLERFRGERWLDDGDEVVCGPSRSARYEVVFARRCDRRHTEVWPLNTTTPSPSSTRAS